MDERSISRIVIIIAITTITAINISITIIVVIIISIISITFIIIVLIYRHYYPYQFCLLQPSLLSLFSHFGLTSQEQENKIHLPFLPCGVFTLRKLKHINYYYYYCCYHYYSD